MPQECLSRLECSQKGGHYPRELCMDLLSRAEQAWERQRELGEPVPSHTLYSADAEKEMSSCRDAESSKGNPADLQAMGKRLEENRGSS